MPLKLLFVLICTIVYTGYGYNRNLLFATCLKLCRWSLDYWQMHSR